MQNEKISVIMPAYNAEAYISFAMDSVLSQTYRNLELLVIDDGSKDRTAGIITEYAEKDPRVHMMKLPVNRGVANARNAGVIQASGNWVAFLDSDDAWEINKLEAQISLAVRKSAVFLFTGSSFIDEEGKKLSSVLKVPEEIRYRELLKQNVISCSSVLIRKELLQTYPMKAGKDMHEDFAVWLQILRTGITAYGINEPLLIYRMHRKSKSGNKMHAAGMTFRVYRYIGLNPAEAFYYWLIYSFRSIQKYRKIK